jgi:hypothetical protein
LTPVRLSRVLKAGKGRVWGLLADPQGWPSLAPLDAGDRVVSCELVRSEGDARVYRRRDRVGWSTVSVQSRVALTPESRLDEEKAGGLRGRSALVLADAPGGTSVSVEDDSEPTGAGTKLLWFLQGGDRVATRFWADFLSQLAGVAESPCSAQLPMYCPSRMLDCYFEGASLEMGRLVNRGGRKIDVSTLTVYNDDYWRGIYPPDSRAPAWVFQNGFNKKFSSRDGEVVGVTMTFDNRINGNNRAVPVDPSDPSKGVLLEYTDPQYSLFYDVLKVTSDDVVVGKAFTGKYPSGVLLLNFTMARRYSFDFMTPDDHRELFEKYGKAPDVRAIPGEWEGKMVSNASLTPPLFRFWYAVDASGKVSCRWNFMNILKGNSRIELTREQMLMFDFTNFHDEIRMVRDDAMVGRYLPRGERVLDLIGDRDLGLLHFEKGKGGEQPTIYYYIRKVAGPEASGVSGA